MKAEEKFKINILFLNTLYRHCIQLRESNLFEQKSIHGYELLQKINRV